MAIGEIIGWILINKVTLIEGYLAVIGIASVIVKLTPTVRDDNILKGVLRFLGKIVALNRK